MVQPSTSTNPTNHKTDEQRLALALEMGLQRAVSAFPDDVLTAMASAERVSAHFVPDEDSTQDLYPVGKPREAA